MERKSMPPAGSAPPLQHDECCATAMRKASRRLGQLYDAMLQPCGLKSTQLSVLVEVMERADAPPTVQELAASLVMDRSTVGHNLKPLERDGWIELRQDFRDLRMRHVVLTAAGKAKCREAQTLWRAAQDQFLHIYGHAQAARLRDALLAIAYDERIHA